MFWFYSAKEEWEKKVKPPPWKKMTTGREVVSVSVFVGTKRRNQRLSCRRKMWFVFVCVGACYKVKEGMNFFFIFLFWLLGV